MSLSDFFRVSFSMDLEYSGHMFLMFLLYTFMHALFLFPYFLCYQATFAFLIIPLLS